MFQFKSVLIGLAATLSAAVASAGELKVISAGAVLTPAVADDDPLPSIGFTGGSTTIHNRGKRCG